MFGDLPLHPVVVHLPLALAILIPILVIAVLVGMAKCQWPRSVWLAVVLFCALGAVSGFAALQTGEDVEDPVEEVVSKDLIHEHEGAAEWFARGLWILFFASLLHFVPRKNQAARWPYITTLVLSIWVLTMGLRTGHTGGSLVYEHNAASALQPKTPAP